MTDDVSAGIARIIAEQAMIDASDIRPETTLDELGLDSLALVEVVFGIEETFDISVPYNANDPTESDFKLNNVGEIIAGVNQLIAQKDEA